MTILKCSSGLLALALLLPVPARGETLSKVEVAKLGKAATALVEVREGKGSGSAFCLHPSGLFLTNEHVVRGAGETVTLVLNSGLKTQKVFKARVVRADGVLDLALLRAEAGEKYPALALGSDEELSELMELVAFGFPFGKNLTLEKDAYPSVSVNAGAVNSLRRKGGELHRIQMDAGVNPGCSGGPVLDLSGKVIGVVVAGVGGTIVNFAIPVSHVARLLSRPDLAFIPPALDRSNRHKPVQVQARAVPLLPADGPLSLHLILKTEGRTQRYPMEHADGLYRVTVTPVPPAEGTPPRNEAAGEIPYVSFTIVASRGDKELNRLSKTAFIKGVDRKSIAARPPGLDRDRVIRQLPAPVADVAVGGGGRFLILHLPRQGKLAIFDVNEARITHSIPAEDDVKFAAGLDSLVVVTAKGVLQRYSLRGFEPEESISMPFRGVVRAVALGSGSNGPLLVRWATGTDAQAQAISTFFDLDSLKPLPWKIVGAPAGRHDGNSRDNVHLRAAANGSVFGLWCTGGTPATPTGLQTIAVRGGEARSSYDNISVGHVLPGTTGQVICTGAGLYTADLKKLAGSHPGGHAYLPASEGPYYLAVPTDNAPKEAVVYLENHDKPVATLTGIELPAPGDPNARDDFTFDKRIHFIPAAGLIVTIPASNDQLILHRFRVEDALKKLDLWVSSRPPAAVKAGEMFRYPVVAVARKGDVTYRLVSGPPGMSISDGGVVEWRVPEHLGPAECSAFVRVRDGEGREHAHRFSVQVEGTAPLVSFKPIGDRPGSANTDGQFLAAATAQEVLIWDVKAGREIRKFAREIKGPLLSAGGQHLAGLVPDGLRVWNVKTGEDTLRVKGQVLKPIFSNDGKRLAAGFRPEPAARLELKVWETATGREIAVFKEDAASVGGLLLTPDGKFLVAAFGMTLKVWDVAAGQQLVTLQMVSFPQFMTASPDGKQLAVTSPDAVRVFATVTGKEALSLPYRGAGYLAYSPDGERLACWTPQGPVIHDTRTGKVLCKAGAENTPGRPKVSFSPDGKLLAAACGPEIKLWDAGTGELVLRLRQDNLADCFFVRPDGKHLATFSRDSTVRVWELSRATPRGAN